MQKTRGTVQCSGCDVQAFWMEIFNQSELAEATSADVLLQAQLCHVHPHDALDRGCEAKRRLRGTTKSVK